ncbi:LLM class F420-dependent oxidoreductase [Embleya sp. NBC_00888]|uniref:LLM class F420-dependent oxidoreductase n=1 Tax=Embleya sp. NBC_00888 TaxID=2975960 RepID=UPI00386D7642|nr:LLM class F420-dependent oxidoreductase [Embleya sp. NBC_00888]
MRLGLTFGYWGRGPSADFVELAREAERLGFDAVWTAESWGSDAFTPLTWIAAHTSRIKLGTAVTQMTARTPTATAMHALTLDHLSGGRVILGLGLSGPQVVEGWYGRPFPKSPLTFTREYVDVIRQVLRREGPVVAEGRYARHPYTGEDGSGLGKSLKSITHPLRADLPIFLGAEGPKNIHLTTRIADGWLPLHWAPTRPEVYADALRDKPDGFRIAPMVQVALGDDVEQAMFPIKAAMGFYVGGMGAKNKNFHADLMRRFGYAEEADRIQELFMAGRRDEAIAAVPSGFVDEIALVGPADRIRERYAAWAADPHVTDMIVTTRNPTALKLLAELAS